MARKFTYFFIVTIISYLLVELICWLFITIKYIPASKPNFKFSWKEKTYPYQIADLQPAWGTWHYPENFTFSRDCFSVPYLMNSYGARDKEWKQTAADSNSVIVLGDSFIEGFGIADSNRLSNLLSKKTGRQFLNFGCSDFSTTQEYLVYKHLASGFAHNTILISLLPINDFYDNDLEARRGLYDGMVRYRPFYIKQKNNYSLQFSDRSFQQATFNKEGYFKKHNSFIGTVARFLRANTYWFHILDYFRHRRKADILYKNNYSGFVNYTAEDFERFCFILNQIKMAAPEKRIILFTIPVATEIKRYKSDGQNKLAPQLAAFCKNSNIEFVDLLPVFASAPEQSYFLSCDPHWNEAANQLAAEYLYQYLQTDTIHQP